MLIQQASLSWDSVTRLAGQLHLELAEQNALPWDSVCAGSAADRGLGSKPSAHVGSTRKRNTGSVKGHLVHVFSALGFLSEHSRFWCLFVLLFLLNLLG